MNIHEAKDEINAGFCGRKRDAKKIKNVYEHSKN